MIFVDTNVFMYAVGRPHALQTPAQDFFVEANRKRHASVHIGGGHAGTGPCIPANGKAANL